METYVFAAVLCAAAFHATWNALIKVGLDPLRSAALMALSATAIAAVILPFLVQPLPAAWPWVVLSTITHLGYFAGLVEAYRSSDYGQVYPIARGAAPLMTATVATVAVGEHVGLTGWIGIVLLATGVLLLSLRGGRDLERFDRRGVGFALFTALTVCTYSVVDGVGARVSGAPVAYTLWLFVGIAVTLIPYAMWRGGRGVFTGLTGYWKQGLIGGGLQIASYGIALWAMTLAPIAIVAALRETSVLFGAAIAVIVLKEPLRQTRIVAAAMIVSGLVLIRLA